MNRQAQEIIVKFSSRPNCYHNHTRFAGSMQAAFVISRNRNLDHFQLFPANRNPKKVCHNFRMRKVTSQWTANLMDRLTAWYTISSFWICIIKLFRNGSVENQKKQSGWNPAVCRCIRRRFKETGSIWFSKLGIQARNKNLNDSGLWNDYSKGLYSVRGPTLYTSSLVHLELRFSIQSVKICAYAHLTEYPLARHF